MADDLIGRARAEIGRRRELALDVRSDPWLFERRGNTRGQVVTTDNDFICESGRQVAKHIAENGSPAFTLAVLDAFTAILEGADELEINGGGGLARAFRRPVLTALGISA